MTTDILYSVLGCITIIVTILIAIYNCINHQDVDSLDDFKVVLADGTGTTDDPRRASLNWKDFQAEHIITTIQHPEHLKWCVKCWEDYIQEGKIILSNEIHSIISVVDDGDIILDFNPLDQNNMVHEDPKNGQKWYKSANSRTIFHLQTDQGECKVFKQTARYLAAIESVDMCPKVITDSRLTSSDKPVWIPVCLAKIPTSKLWSFKKIK